MSLSKYVIRFNRINSTSSSLNGITNMYVKTIPAKTILWFTDGSCTKNGKKNSSGGFAALCVLGYKGSLLIYGKVDDSKIKATNIRAEGIAILHILDLLQDEIKSTNWNTAIIYSDSEFWIKMIYNYMPKWKMDAFDKKANPDLTKKIWHMWNAILSSGKSIEIIHVFAHNKDNGATSTVPFKRFCHDNNELVDELANEGRELPDYRIRHTSIS